MNNMKQIRLMPVGSMESLRHLFDTIINPVSKEKIKNYLNDEEFSKLNEVCDEELIPLWGLEPGKMNEVVWDNLIPEDILIFVPSNEDLIITKLKYKVKNRNLAERLWGTSERSGGYWDLLVFLEVIAVVNIEKRALLDYLGYSELDVLQSNRDVTEKFLKEFGSLKDFINKYSDEKFNLENLKEMGPEEVFKRKGSQISKRISLKKEGDELELLEREIPKFESLLGIPGVGISQEKLDEMKKRANELKVIIDKG